MWLCPASIQTSIGALNDLLDTVVWISLDRPEQQTRIEIDRSYSNQLTRAQGPFWNRILSPWLAAFSLRVSGSKQILYFVQLIQALNVCVWRGVPLRKTEVWRLELFTKLTSKFSGADNAVVAIISRTCITIRVQFKLGKCQLIQFAWELRFGSGD